MSQYRKWDIFEGKREKEPKFKKFEYVEDKNIYFSSNFDLFDAFFF
jgi:hypothetical protein